MTTKLEKAIEWARLADLPGWSPTRGLALEEGAPWIRELAAEKPVGAERNILACRIQASILLDGSPGGRWPHPHRRTGAKR